MQLGITKLRQYVSSMSAELRQPSCKENREKPTNQTRKQMYMYVPVRSATHERRKWEVLLQLKFFNRRTRMCARRAGDRSALDVVGPTYEK